MAVGQVLGQAVGGQAERVGLRASAAAALSAQDHGHPVRVGPAVVGSVAIDGGHGDGLTTRGKGEMGGHGVALAQGHRHGQAEAGTDRSDAIGGGRGAIGGEARRHVGGAGLALTDQAEGAEGGGLAVLVGAQLGQGGQAGRHGLDAGGHVDPVALRDRVGLGLRYRHGVAMPGVVIGAPKPAGQGQTIAAGPQQVAQHRPQHGAAVSGGVGQKGQGPAATGRGHGYIQAAMAGPIKAAHRAATSGPWAAVMFPGRSGEAVQLGQLEQGGHERPGRGGAVSSGGDGGGEGAGRQVVEDHGAGLGLALAELRGLPVAR